MERTFERTLERTAHIRTHIGAHIRTHKAHIGAHIRTHYGAHVEAEDRARSAMYVNVPKGALWVEMEFPESKVP